MFKRETPAEQARQAQLAKEREERAAAYQRLKQEEEQRKLERAAKQAEHDAG